MHSLLKRFLVIGSLAGLGVLGLIGCGGGGGGSDSGTLTVRLADAPDPTITAVNVTIDRVEAHVNGEWIPITTTPATFNLYDLVDNDTILGSTSLPAGSYTQIRLFPSAAQITDSDGTHDVEVPSGDQTGVKVLVNYDIQANEVTTVLLDFNVDQSFNKLGNGQYQMQPVIKGVVKILSGTITGAVTRDGSALQGATVKAIYKDGTAYPVDTEVNSSATMEDGTYKIWALLPGTYQVQVSYTDPDTLEVFTAVVNDLVVEANANTDAGSVAVTLAP